MNREKPNRRELSAIEYIAALDSQLLTHQEVLHERLSKIPNGWRDYRLIVTKAASLLERLYTTLPTKTLLRIQATCRQSEIVIRLHPPCRTAEHVLVSEDDLRELINKTMAAECAVCLLDGNEIRACSLRKTLEGIAPPEEYPKTGCAYRNVVLSSDYMNYI